MRGLRHLSKLRLADPFQSNIRWWCKKYKLPPTDKRLSRYTPEELYIERLEDVLEANPTAFYEDGEVDDMPDIVTDDEEVNQVNAMLDQGLDVDSVLDSWESPEQQAYWKRFKEARTQAVQAPDDISDDFTAETEVPVQKPTLPKWQ